MEAKNSEEAVLKAEQGYYDGIYVLDGVECDRENSFNDIRSPEYLSEKRKDQNFDNLIDYVSEHTTDEKDFRNALENIIGLTDGEIKNLGIEFDEENEEMEY